MFQFQLGAIKSQLPQPRAEDREGFQFQLGAIKSWRRGDVFVGIT